MTLTTILLYFEKNLARNSCDTESLKNKSAEIKAFTKSFPQISPLFNLLFRRLSPLWRHQAAPPLTFSRGDPTAAPPPLRGSTEMFPVRYRRFRGVGKGGLLRISFVMRVDSLGQLGGGYLTATAAPLVQWAWWWWSPLANYAHTTVTIHQLRTPHTPVTHTPHTNYAHAAHN